MKALIFNGSTCENKETDLVCDSASGALASLGWTVKTLLLQELTIAPCLGCFDCWLRTPGQCVIDDDGRKTTAMAVDSGLWIFVTPVTFGGYSSELKKAVDRILPIFVPVFTKVSGETHHEIRYRDHPKLLGIGINDEISEQDKRVFQTLVSRNALNFRSPGFGVIILRSSECGASAGFERIGKSITDICAR